MLKLAVDVQGAGAGRLCGSYRRNIRSEVRVGGQVQRQRALCLVRLGCCEFRFWKSLRKFVIFGRVSVVCVIYCMSLSLPELRLLCLVFSTFEKCLDF